MLQPRAFASLLLLLHFIVAADDTNTSMNDKTTATPSPQLPGSESVDEIMSRLTLAEKLGQMVQLEIAQFTDGPTVNTGKLKNFVDLCIGSAFGGFGLAVDGKFNIGAPQFRTIIQQIQNAFMQSKCKVPMFFALDSVHGANYIDKAVILPHSLTLAASFNLHRFKEAGRIAAKDTLAGGFSLLFHPVSDLGVIKMWARFVETPSECPYLTSVFVETIIEGIQSIDKAAACVKHFLAYFSNKYGFDRTDATVSNFALKNYVLKPYQHAIKAGVMSVMESYNSVNKVPVASSSELLDVLLREKLGFKGLLLTDYQEILNLQFWHRTAVTTTEASISSLNVSIDVTMEANQTVFIDQVYPFAEKNDAAKAHIDTAVRRILEFKQKLGLLQNPVPGEEYVNTVGSKEDKQAALEMARESIVMLKNENSTLPLAPRTKVLVVGKCSNETSMMFGAWTKDWQGVYGNEKFPDSKSVLDYMIIAAGSYIVYEELVQINGSFVQAELDAILNKAKEFKVIMYTLCEEHSTEKPGDIWELKYPEGHYTVIDALLSTNVPMILVQLTTRPRLIRSFVDKVAALLYAGRPGDGGAQAIAEIVYGIICPSGRLPFTYPLYESTSSFTYYETASTRCVGYTECPSQFAFGTGLSYTTFEYSDLSLSKSSIYRSEKLNVTLTVTNTGKMYCKDTVTLFLMQPFRKIAEPESKLLKRFFKVDLQPGKAHHLEFELTEDDWTVYNTGEVTDLTPHFEESLFYVAIGADTTCDMFNQSAILGPRCARFNVQENTAV